jgi:hypothetical protein
MEEIMDTVRTKEDIARLDGRPALVVGRYEAVGRPVRGRSPSPGAKDHAQVVLSDGTRVYLEPYDRPASRRPAEERRACDGKMVVVTGTVFRVMPSSGQSPIAPCIADVGAVQANAQQDGE